MRHIVRQMERYQIEHEVDDDGEDAWDVVDNDTGEVVQSFRVHIEAREYCEKLNKEPKPIA